MHIQRSVLRVSGSMLSTCRLSGGTGKCVFVPSLVRDSVDDAATNRSQDLLYDHDYTTRERVNVMRGAPPGAQAFLEVTQNGFV